jgi:hypothetical protein
LALEVTLPFTTPQILPSFFLLTSSPRHFSSAHTRSVTMRGWHHSANSEALRIPGGIVAHGLSGFEPEPFGLATEVTVNFTIPRAYFLAKRLCDKKTYAVPVA